MPSRAIVQLANTQQLREGGGFLVRRPVGNRGVSNVDPFIMLDHLGPVDYKPGEAIGAPDHPHRGFETVTYVIDGGIEHKDSAGNTGILKPGWVQWMTAGRGVVHSEMPPADLLKRGGRMEGFQLWVNLPKSHKFIAPRYQDTPAANVPEVTSADGKTFIRVLAGSALGQTSPIETHIKILLLDIRISAGGCYDHPLPNSYQGFVYCWRGKGKVGSADAAITMGQVAVLSESAHGDSFTMKASPTEECRLLFACGEPIGEPVVQHGPFVMNTEEEIQEAINDYRSGKLGEIPGAEKRYQETEAARNKQKASGTW
ncbi:uncharacterized protein [Watersipora subatra]|uniref:uncharacterized protein n=1 Tax=Watersipora subatra TaxID=2589382 RepID=UPI00355B73E8